MQILFSIWTTNLYFIRIYGEQCNSIFWFNSGINSLFVTFVDKMPCYFEYVNKYSYDVFGMLYVSQSHFHGYSFSFTFNGAERRGVNSHELKHFTAYIETQQETQGLLLQLSN